MTLIDIGANLTHDSFDHDRESVLSRASDAGVKQLVVTGASLEGSRAAIELAEGDERLFATTGIHPHHAEEGTVSGLTVIKELARTSVVRAVGETGLDFFRDFSPRDQQEASFELHMETAIELDMPMFLHERDAFPRFAEMIAAHRDHLGDVVVHCFTGDREALYRYLDLDCHIGVTGWICDERRGAHLIPLMNDIPPDRLMLETDAPYLLPRNVRPKPKSRRNEPHYLTVVAAAVAAATGETVEELANRTTETARRFFGLPAQ